MKILHYFFITCLSLCAGIFFCAYMQEWIIIRFPFTSTLASSHTLPEKETQTIKKKVKLTFWQHNKWKTEYQDLIWSSDSNKNIHYLINSWLSLLDEESIMDKKVTLQTVMTNAHGQDAYLSFDQNILDPEQSTFANLMVIEGLLKTLRDNDIKVQSVRFLVHHQPLIDDHLDFSNSWPITGFLS